MFPLTLLLRLDDAAAGRGFQADRRIDDRRGASHANLDVDRVGGTVDGAGTALHAGVTISDDGDTVVHREHPMRADDLTQRAADAFLFEEKCIGCSLCEIVCPHGVFTVDDRIAVIGDRDACMECGACAINCPTDAIYVKVGVGCAAAVINAAIGLESSSCCCVIEPEQEGQGEQEESASSCDCC